MSSNSTKMKASSRRKVKSIPKAKPLVVSGPVQPYLVVDTTLPSHIVTDRSLFTTYTAGRRVYHTTFGHNIIIEGTGDVLIRVLVAGQYISFRMRNCWHVPSSAHHFLSCASVTARGHQVMIAGRSPRMIYSHKCRLVEPKLPKYIPFTQVDGLIVLNFDIIPADSAQPASTTSESHSPAQPIVSLQASTFLPFAGLAFEQHSLPTSHQAQVSSNVHGHASASVMLDMSSDVALHGGADVLVGPVVDAGFLLTDNVNVANGDAVNTVTGVVVVDDGVSALGGADAQLMVSMDLPAGVVEVDDGGAQGGAALLVAHDVTVMGDVTVNGDAKDQAVDPHGGDPYHQQAAFLDTLNLSSNFFDLQVEDNFLIHLSTPSFSRTSSLSRSFSSILNVNPYSPLSFSHNKFSFSSPFSTLTLSESSFSTSVQQLPVHATFPLFFFFWFFEPFSFFLFYNHMVCIPTTLFPLHRRSIFRVFPFESVQLLQQCQHYHLATVPFSHLTCWVFRFFPRASSFLLINTRRRRSRFQFLLLLYRFSLIFHILSYLFLIFNFITVFLFLRFISSIFFCSNSTNCPDSSA
jgi:hypothetical protein